MLKLDIQLFADGKIVIETEVDNSGIKKGVKDAENNVNKAGSTIKGIIAGLGITKLISTAMNTINASIDGAVKRVDTLNNFPKVMNNLGISSKDASKSINTLSSKLTGLPTTLNDAASAVQRLTSANGDINKSTEIFLAMNNAIIAGGASMDTQATAMEQLSQAYAKGKPDAMEWRSILTAMPAQLKQMAKELGYTSTAVGGDFYGAIQDGKLSMDDFMNTIIKLNKNGNGEFASFEKQARSATGGVATSVQNMKTAVARGVANLIKSLDKSLKKAKLGGISNVLDNIGKTAENILKKIGNALKKVDFKKIINALKTIIPLIGSAVTAFIAYESVLKIVKTIDYAKNIINMITTFGTLIPTIKNTSTAMVALNTAFSANPVGLIIAGIVGLTAAIVGLLKVTKEEESEQDKLINQLDDYNNSINELEKSRNKKIQSELSEIQSTQDLWKELQNITDENGKVKEGYEARANYITGQLSEALGVEAKLNGNIVEGYNNIKNSIADIIKQKRAKVILDAQEEIYNKAKEKEVELEEALTKASKNLGNAEKEKNKWIKDTANAYGLTQDELEKLLNTNDVFNKSLPISGNELINLQGKYSGLNNSIRITDKTLKNARETYAENKKTITDYEISIGNLENKNYDAVLKMYEDTVDYQAKTKQATSNNYSYAIQEQKNYLSQLEKDKNLYDEETFKVLQEKGKQRLQELQKQQDEQTSTIKNGQQKTKSIWDMSLNEQIKLLKDKNVEFKKTADGHIQAYIDGQESGKPVSKKKAKQFGEDIANEIDKSKEKSKIAGENLIDGTTQGIKNNNKQNAAFGAISNFGNNLLAKLKKSLDEHSPSKASRQMGRYLIEGLGLGIDDEKQDILNDIINYGQEIIDKMQDTIEIETDRMSANVQTSGTYQVAMAGTPQFNLVDNASNTTQLVVNGKVLAEVVNTENRNREVARA